MVGKRLRKTRRAGSDSRCCDPSLGPFEWRDYIDDQHPSVREIAEWLSSLPHFEQEHQKGEIEALLERAAAGLIEDSADAKTSIKPIWEDPEIFELRRRALTKHLRFYHGEPEELPKHLIAVHKHIKHDSRSQQLEIEDAAGRYRAGRPNRWML